MSEKFLKEDICPFCHGSRLNEAARAPKLSGLTLDEVCQMTLAELVDWVRGVPESLPEEMRPMAESICESFLTVAKRLMDLGLGYLTLDRAASTLSTGERQRMQLARAVRNRTTGVLYVLDEPSIGLHPSNIVGLHGVMHDLVADGNSVLLVDHDTQILSEADWIIEMGPEAGAGGGYVIAEGTVQEIEANPVSMIGPFLAGDGRYSHMRNRCNSADRTVLSSDTFICPRIAIHTVKSLEVDIPKGQTDGRHRCIRFREDDPDSGKPSACFARLAFSGSNIAARSMSGSIQAEGICTCKADRCDADRDQCALYGSDLRQCAR